MSRQLVSVGSLVSTGKLMHRELLTRIPRYIQIASALRRRLSTSACQTGHRLSSENQLAAEFSVSRETVRAALRLLREEGAVHAVVGRGTFVSPGRKPIGVRITLPISDPYIAGRPSAMRILSEGLAPSPPDAARALAIRPHTPLYTYTILRTIKGQPFRYAKVYLPEEISRRLGSRSAPGLTISEKLERNAGLRLVRCTQTVFAVPAPKDAAGMLNVPAGTSVLFFRRVYFDLAGTAVEFAIDYQDSTRFPYEEVLVSSRK